MTHRELCYLTAKRFVKTLCIYESTCSMREKPDVLNFNSNATTDMFEIKMSRADFLKDKDKFARNYALFGDKRYYVCYGDFIKLEDLPEGWGLYWYIDGKFHLKQESKDFRYYEDYEHIARRQKCNSILLINTLAYCKDNIIFSKRILENRVKYGIKVGDLTLKEIVKEHRIRRDCTDCPYDSNHLTNDYKTHLCRISCSNIGLDLDQLIEEGNHDQD